MELLSARRNFEHLVNCRVICIYLVALHVRDFLNSVLQRWHEQVISVLRGSYWNNIIILTTDLNFLEFLLSNSLLVVFGRLIGFHVELLGSLVVGES